MWRITIWPLRMWGPDTVDLAGIYESAYKKARIDGYDESEATLLAEDEVETHLRRAKGRREIKRHFDEDDE